MRQRVLGNVLAVVFDAEDVGVADFVLHLFVRVERRELHVAGHHRREDRENLRGVRPLRDPYLGEFGLHCSECVDDGVERGGRGGATGESEIPGVDVVPQVHEPIGETHPGHDSGDGILDVLQHPRALQQTHRVLHVVVADSLDHTHQRRGALLLGIRVEVLTYLVAKRHEHFDELHRVRNLAKRLAVDVARLSARGDDDVIVRFIRGGRLGLGFRVGIVGRDADEPRERYLVVALPLRVRVRVAVSSRPCPGVVELRGGGVRDRVRLQDLIHHTFELVVDRDAPGAGGVPRVNVGIDGIGIRVRRRNIAALHGEQALARRLFPREDAPPLHRRDERVDGAHDTRFQAPQLLPSTAASLQIRG